MNLPYAFAADFLIIELHRCYHALVCAGANRLRHALNFRTMTLRRQTFAFVSLAAAYAVILQAVLLSICGALAASQAFGAVSLCTPSRGGEHQPAPAGHGNDCLSACLACCCGMAVPPKPGAAKIDPQGAVQHLAPPALLGVATSLRTDWAHRSRGPPLA